MANFTIIEDGRLKDSEMNSIKGGRLDTFECFKQTYSVQECPGYPEGYSICPIQYMSCIPGATSFKMCSGATDGYKGPTGPAGYTL